MAMAARGQHVGLPAAVRTGGRGAAGGRTRGVADVEHRVEPGVLQALRAAAQEPGAQRAGAATTPTDRALVRSGGARGPGAGDGHGARRQPSVPAAERYGPREAGAGHGAARAFHVRVVHARAVRYGACRRARDVLHREPESGRLRVRLRGAFRHAVPLRHIGGGEPLRYRLVSAKGLRAW